MRLNNKGMSIIEIVVTFALIMVMVMQMLTIVMNYREKANFSLEKLDLDTFKNNITRDIQNDIMKLGVKEINTGGECSSISGLNQCINIVFEDGTEKAFGTSMVDSNDYDSIENKYLYYDGLKYKLHDNLPETIPVGRNVLDFQSIEVVDNNILSTSSAILENGTVVSIYSIDVYVSHVDFDQDFGVHIVAQTSMDDDNDSLNDVDVQYLKDAIFAKYTTIYENPTLTTSSNNTSDPSGLYKSTATNNNQPTYYFRGNIDNNYVSFADQLWRVVRINEDGTIRLIMQDGINDNATYKFNSIGNDKMNMYYSESDTAKSILQNWYQTTIISNGLVDKVSSGRHFCEQARVVHHDLYIPNSGTSLVLYDNYVPDFKCSTDDNNKGVVEASIGLISYDELVHAGGYNGSSNQNYYLYNNTHFWSMSPSGTTGDSSSNSATSVWYVHSSSSVGSYYVSGSRCLRPVINVKADTIVTGLGTRDLPWVVI